MNEDKKEIKINLKRNSLIRTCPVCGFTFRTHDPRTRKKVKICPMCGHKFIELDLPPKEQDSFKKKFF